MEKTENYQIADVSRFVYRLSRIAKHNPDYDLTRREMTEKGLVGQRVYEVFFPCEDVSIVPGRYAAPGEDPFRTVPAADAPAAADPPADTAAPAQPAFSGKTAASADGRPAAPAPADEKTALSAGGAPAGPADGAGAPSGFAAARAGGGRRQEEEEECLVVQSSGEPIGYIRKADYPRIKELLDGGLIVSLDVALHGGAYRMLFEDGILEDGNAGYFGLLSVTSREPEPEKSAPENESGTMHYISTSYDTVLLEERGRRGNGALMLSFILAGVYLGFSIPYWIMIRRGMIGASAFLGGDLPDSLLNPHLALVIAAAVVNLAAIFMKNSILPMLAAALYAGSCWTLPGYAVFTALSAVLCAIAALRKKTGVLLTLIRVLVFFGVLGVCGWLLKDTALYFWNSKTFMIRPTGNESAVPPAGGMYDPALGGSSGEEYDDGFDDGDSDDDFVDDFDDDFGDDFGDDFVDDFGGNDRDGF